MMRTRMMSLGKGVSCLGLIVAAADNTGKHTSMTKEATRAIKDLKNKRKAKEERISQRVSSTSTEIVSSQVGGT